MAGDVVFFRRCPSSYVTPFTTRMLEWYVWLDLWGKTPLDFAPPSFSPDDLDPRYFPAMRVLRGVWSRIEREELEELKNKAGNP